MSQKSPHKFSCEICNYFTCSNRDFNKHLLTRKHKILTNTYAKVHENSSYICICGNTYKHRQSLYHHRKKCKQITSSHNNEISENNELKNMINEVTQIKENSKEIFEEIKKQAQIIIQKNEIIAEKEKIIAQKDEEMSQMYSRVCHTTNNNTNNININMFLNEKCKDAINLSDFIEKIEISHDDLENNAQLGFVNGITKILMDNLNQLTLYQRPIHCTDIKRETMYIKDKDTWNKNNANEKLENAIQEVSRKSIGSLLEWKQTNPEYENIDSDFSKRCISMQMQSIASTNRDIYYPKIIHKLARENSIKKIDSF